MKFSCQVEIDLPVQKVVELFENEENQKKWQEGLVGIEHISGTPGKEGAVSNIIYDNGKNKIELKETILKMDLPKEMIALYEHKHMSNTMRNCFIPLSANKTRLEAHIDYSRFNGFMPKLMALLMPGVFKKQTQRWYNNFKSFAESLN